MFALLVGLIAFAALTPLWLTLTTGASLGVRASAPVAFAIAGIVTTVAVAPEPRAEPTNRPVERAAAGYVGSASCRACHPAEHASWHGSYHRTMTQPATRKVIRASFADDRLDLDFHGQSVLLSWRSDELWVELEQPRGKYPVVQVTGSHHAQVLWYATGNERQLGAVPMVYRIAEERWLPINAVFLMPPEIKEAPAHGTWNSNCISCHTTHAMPRLDTNRTDTHVAEFGIACEACHGPGADHVTRNRNPLRRYSLHLDDGESDDTVTDPQRLDAGRKSEVCGQCHSVSIVRRQHFDSWRDHGSPFRPGQVLGEAQLVVTPAARNAPELRRQLQRDPSFFRNTFWPDGQVRVTGREFNGLLASPCHNQGHGDRIMSCVSCHELHQPADDRRPPSEWANAQLLPGMRGDAACVQCHPEFNDPTARAAHTNHDESISCYDCHMPRTAYGLLKSVRSHVISVPDVQTELATGRPNACNLCHLDKTLEWTSEHLDTWYGTIRPTLDRDQRTVAAGASWMLRGDAAQRVLAADATALAKARVAAGTDWMTPYLAQLLADPYLAVRFVAERSLRSTGNAEVGDYDFLAATAQVEAHTRRIHDAWAPPTASFSWDDFRRLLALRDNRPILLAE